MSTDPLMPDCTFWRIMWLGQMEKQHMMGLMPRSALAEDQFLNANHDTGWL